jgi:hypothetical protein
MTKDTITLHSGTNPVCCGALERMAINWMKLEDGTRCMPYIIGHSDDNMYRVNNCPGCGKYVRDIMLKSDKIKYRDHKGSLSDSIDTIKEVYSVEQIKQHLNKYYKQFEKSVEEIKFEYLGHDDIINWDTYYVFQRLKGETEFTVAGFSDGFLQV